jgi:hypothetical protein
MPVVQIQCADKLIESKLFRNSFYIIRRLNGTRLGKRRRART